MIPKIQILVPVNWSNLQRGDFFEDLTAKLFRQMQFEVTQRIRVTGMEIDLLAENLHSKEKAYIECKFWKEPFGAPVISKLIGNAAKREEIGVAYLVTTIGPGKDAQGVLFEFEEKGNLIRNVLRFAYIGPEELINLYLDVNQYPRLDVRLAESLEKFSAATLVLTPDEACWVVEQQRSGVPHSAFAIPLDPKRGQLEDFEAFKRLVEENKRWPGLQLWDGPRSSLVPTTMPSGMATSEPNRDVITQIPVSDSFDDYNPARPEDFVGRTELQRACFSFFEQVRQSETRKRVIALSGPSGFGKSSVVLKLADRARNRRYRNKFFLFHIDSRSATSPLFMAEAVRVAFQEALDKGFIDLPGLTISIDSIEQPFSSESIQQCLSALQSQERVLIIFFDQFEELLTKEPLFTTFGLFRLAAFAVEALQTNLVLGFSWRTGISFSEDHPAYHMWHSLKDKRAEFRVGLFSNKEASELLGVLQNYLEEKLEHPLRKHLLEQAQGFPWFLKKLCVHVYRQLSSGSSQRELVERQLDAALLFEEDTQDLSSKQLSCLKYIAENSPIDLVEVQERYSVDITDCLYHNRLIVRSGHKYSVYWDIFREYLISGEVPNIPMTYIPQAQLTTSLTVLRHMAREGPVSPEEIKKDFKYTIKTVWNIIGDLSNFFLIKRGASDQLEIVEELQEAESFESSVADYVAEQLRSHIILQCFHEVVQSGEGIGQTGLENLVAEVYPSISLSSLHAYVNRVIPWLRFTGWIELEPPDQIIRPKGVGQDKGKVSIRRSRLIDGKAMFLCTSSPSRVVALAEQLCQKQKLLRDGILGSANRNAAQDLTSLGLAQWQGRALHPVGALAEAVETPQGELRTRCVSAIQERALESRFLRALAKQVSRAPGSLVEDLATPMAQELQRDWHPSSAMRYLNSGISWLRYFGELQKLHGQLSMFEESQNVPEP